MIACIALIRMHTAATSISWKLPKWNKKCIEGKMIICFRIFVGLQHEFMVFDMFISNLFFFSNNLRSFYIIVAQFRLQQWNALFFWEISHLHIWWWRCTTLTEKMILLCAFIFSLSQILWWFCIVRFEILRMQ